MPKQRRLPSYLRASVQESSSQSNSERRKLAAREHLGTHAFEWMKQLKALDQQLAISREFCEDLCWHLIAENEESAVTELLVSEAASFMHQSWKLLFNKKNVTGYRIRRNHNLLGRLIGGHISLSTDGTPNEALRCLSALNKIAEEQGSFDTFQWQAGLTCLRAHLAKDYCAPYNEKLLGGLYEVMRKSSSLKALERNTVSLRLWQPTSPDPFPALKKIKHDLESRVVSQLGNKAVTHLGTELLRVLLILNLQSATSEVEWARSALKKNYGQVWNNRQRIIGSWVKDPKLQHFPGLRAAASATTEDDEGHGIVGDLPVSKQGVTSESLMARKFIK